MSENQSARRILCVFVIVTIAGVGIVAFGQTAQPATPLPIAAQASSPPSPPPFQPLRYDEDWSYLGDESRRSEWLDRLKYFPLNEHGWYLSLGGEERIRYEYFSQFNFGAGPQDDDGYLLQRYLLHADTHFGKRVRVFTQLQSAIGSWRNGGPRPTDDDWLEAHQAFLDLKFGDEAKSLTFRVGRHEMDFGAGRSISAGEGLNVRRSIDGLRVIYRQGPWLINGQINKLVSIKSGLFNDGPDSSQTFWGVGATRSRPKIRGGHQYKGEKLFDIAFIIVKVRRNAHRVSANADKNLGFRQTLAQAGRGAAWQSYPDHVTNPVAGRKRCAAQLRRFPGDQPSQRGERMLDIFNLPFENLLQCGDGHRRQDEIGEFAHVKPARARPVFVPVINQAREILAPGARKP